jgi:hypothetical protein
MTKPTVEAETWFRLAAQHSSTLMFPHHALSDADRNFWIANCFNDLGKGLGHLAIGLRATYMLLERVEQKLDQQKISVR